MVTKDDETYVSKSNLVGHHIFHMTDPHELLCEEKVRKNVKFPRKYCISQCNSSHGESLDPVISEGSFNEQVYLTSNRKVGLEAFINKVHRNANILFWPDLTTSKKMTACQI